MIKRALFNQYVTLALRLLVGLTFLFASIEKITETGEFATAIANYKIISGSSTLVVATILPWIELLCGLAVLSGIYFRGAILLLFTMVSIFTLAVISGLIRGLDISCGCFTLDPNVHRIAWQKVVENLGLIAACALLFYSKITKFAMRTDLANS